MTLALQDAVAELRANPNKPVTTQIDGLLVEIRRKAPETADDVFEAVGPWEGESAEELTHLLLEARRESPAKKPPRF